MTALMTEPAHPESPSQAQAQSESGTPELSSRRRRMVFRANHRGTHESDLLVGGFVLARIADFTESELDQIEEILELPDVDLTEWLTGRQPIPTEMESPMLIRMRDAAGK
jgi:antitoxin CptB